MNKQTSNNLPKIVIFGRTNVGKSTLFNALTEKRSALVSRVHGTTRDSNIGQVEWNNTTFTLIDTGGIIEIDNLFKKRKEKIKEIKTLEDLDIKVQELVQENLKNADLILFLTDVQDGILPQDKELAKEIKKRKDILKKTILVTNKADSPKLRHSSAEFSKLGIGKPFPLSATTGSGTGDLLDLVVEKIISEKRKHKSSNETHQTTDEVHGGSDARLPRRPDNEINVCIIGKPNVGKSSLVNSILGEEKIIVSPIPHTTREPNDTKIEYKGKNINLIDTAGISKTGHKNTKKIRSSRSLESFSINKTLKVLNKADIALLILDVNDGLTHQDSKIVSEIIERNISLIIIANKWDMIEERDTKKYTKDIYMHLPFATWAPIQFVSAKTGEKVQKIFDLILEINEKRGIEINENYLSKFLQKLVKWHKPSKSKGTKHPYIYELNQTGSNPPKFQIRIGSKDSLSDSYLRFIQNKLREKFELIGTPVQVSVTRVKKIHGMKEGDSFEKNK